MVFESNDRRSNGLKGIEWVQYMKNDAPSWFPHRFNSPKKSKSTSRECSVPGWNFNKVSRNQPRMKLRDNRCSQQCIQNQPSSSHGKANTFNQTTKPLNPTRLLQNCAFKSERLDEVLRGELYLLISMALAGLCGL